MKFTWFNLMPWPYLPADFRQKYRSVWVDIPSELYDPVKGHALYHTYLDQLEYADQLGFDGLGVNEHHANGYGLMPSPNMMSNSTTRNGGETLFLTTVTRVWVPTVWWRPWSAPKRRTSRRTVSGAPAAWPATSARPWPA